MSMTRKVTEDLAPIFSKSIVAPTALYAGGSTCTSYSSSVPPLVSANVLPLTRDNIHGGTYSAIGDLPFASRSSSSCCLDTSKDARLMRFASSAAFACFHANMAANADTPMDRPETAAPMIDRHSDSPMKPIVKGN